MDPFGFGGPRLEDGSPPWPATEIISGVWQSGYPEPGEHWDAVIDLDGAAPPLDGVAFYVHWPIDDGPPPDRAVLTALADLVDDLRRADKKVLIHCAAGINRSALLAAATLMRSGIPAGEAIATVRKRRPGSLNNPEFVRRLNEGL
ncbi:MAG: dual specificity protein phosphatase family protein [Actinobacteria bacterium]|nr:dual specificity protein phosphatase family protein [Actinomycetota bacterium]